MLPKQIFHLCPYQGRECQVQSPRARGTPELLSEMSDQLGLDWGSDREKRPEAILIHSDIEGRSEPVYIVSENAIVLINN